VTEYRHPFFYTPFAKGTAIKKFVFTFALKLFIVIALVLMNTPTSVQGNPNLLYQFQQRVHGLDSNDHYGGICLVTSPSGSAVRITNTGNIARMVSTAGYYGISVTSNLAVRAYHRILKLAQTIADLSGGEEILSTHLTETLQYCPKIMMG
jgi:hypothetical protein